MTIKNANDDTHIEYRTLFIICNYCFIISILIIPISIVVFFKWPLYPANILDIMVDDKLAGIMSLDFVYFLGSFASIPMLLVYYLTTRKIDQSLALLALTLGLMGLMALYTSRPIVEMLGLGAMYGKASTELSKTQIAELSSAFLLFFRGTTFNIHYVLGNISLLITSFLMLNNKYYSKAIGYAGIITTVLVFTLYIPIVGVYLSTLSVVGYIVWWVLAFNKFRTILKAKA
jgi:hypothetical protein